jgi:hypothetical protein
MGALVEITAVAAVHTDLLSLFSVTIQIARANTGSHEAALARVALNGGARGEGTAISHDQLCDTWTVGGTGSIRPARHRRV